MEKYRYKHKKNFKEKKKKSIFQNKFLWISVFLFLVGGISFFGFLFSPFFQEKKIIILGINLVKENELKNVIERGLSKKIGFFETKNVFLADLGKISGDIVLKFPQIFKISISRNFRREIAVVVNERKPEGILCNSASCFYYDKGGIIFEESFEDFRPKIKTESPDYNIKIGNKELPEKIINAVSRTQKALSENFSVKDMDFIISQDARNLTVETSEGWKVFFDPEGDIELQVANLISLLKEINGEKERQKVDYINLRYSKIFYKKK